MGVFPEMTVPVRGEPFLIPNEMLMTTHGALTKGDVVAVDFSTGSAGGPATTTKALAGTETEYGVIGVAKHTSASGSPCVIVFRGAAVECKFTGNLTRGAPLNCEGANARLKTVATNTRVVAILLTTANGGVEECFFNGVEGLGFKGT